MLFADYPYHFSQNYFPNLTWYLIKNKLMLTLFNTYGYL